MNTCLLLHQDRFMELVPNQNSFGHMHRWLNFDKYRNLSEMPEGFLHAFNNKVEPYSLCPILPESLDLLKDLYSQVCSIFAIPFADLMVVASGFHWSYSV